MSSKVSLFFRESQAFNVLHSCLNIQNHTKPYKDYMQMHINIQIHTKLYVFTYNFIYLPYNYMQKHIKQVNHENTSRFCKRKKK